MKLKKLLILLVGLLVLVGADDEIAKYSNKDTVTLKGKTEPQYEVDIYVNDKVAKTVTADDEGAWEIVDLPLKKEGLNTVYAISRADDGSKSKLSAKINVYYDKTPPAIYQINIEPNVVKPQATLNMTVKTDSDADSVSIVLPDTSLANFEKSTDVSNTWTYSWTVPVKISGGDYRLLVTAQDKSGNINQKNSLPIKIDAMASLVVSVPEEGSVVYDDDLTVRGFARNCESVMINDKTASLFNDAQFNGVVNLPKNGRNQITVKSMNNNGVVVEKTLDIIKLKTFSDISRHWARKPIEYLATLGYVDGYPGGTLFKPNNVLSRAELAAVLVRTKQYPISFSGDRRSSFTDVPDNYWAAGYIDSAVKYNLVEGYPGNKYKPQNVITRAEAAAMFVRFANIPIMEQERATDTDVGRKHWASAYIAAFKAAGLMPSEWRNNAKKFYPDQPITRAEVCAIFARVPEINREIELMLGRKTEWSIVVENPAILPTDAYAESTVINSQPIQDAGSLLVGIITPKETVPGGEIKLSVAAALKMQSITALFPDKTEQTLIYDAKNDIWETVWSIPLNYPNGSYKTQLKAVDVNDKIYAVDSNPFEVKQVAVPKKAAETLPPAVSSQPADQTPLVYPEYVTGIKATYPPIEEASEEVKPLPLPASVNIQEINTSVAKEVPKAGAAYEPGESLTRAVMADLLAKYGKIKYAAKVVAPPAADVPLQHPYVRAIKSAIVTGMIPNVQNNQYSPERTVTKKEAAAVIKRLQGKVPAGVAVDESNITVAEFETWLKESI